MKRIIVFVLLLCGVTLMAFTYDDLFPKRELFAELSHAKKLPLNGRWKITAYCPYSCCNTAYTKTGSIDYTNQAAIGGITLIGLLENGINVVAVDPALIPLGSIIKYNNRYYIAVDTGSAVKGFTLDILVASHEKTIQFGVRYSDTIEVYIPLNRQEVIQKVRKVAGVRIP